MHINNLTCQMMLCISFFIFSAHGLTIPLGCPKSIGKSMKENLKTENLELLVLGTWRKTRT